MKGFGKFVTFVGVTGAALAGLWYFCEMNKDKQCACECDDISGEKKSGERSYVSLDPELKAKVEEKVAENKETLKKAVKSAAHDIMTKAEDAARGVGLVKDDKKTSEFEFEDFDKTASQIDIQ